MCTYIDGAATEKMEKRLKGRKASYAWKVVRVSSYDWFAPYQRTPPFPYSQHNRTYECCRPLLSVVDTDPDPVDATRPCVTDGAFHLSLTRKSARAIYNYIKFYSSSDKHKVVKVSFKPKDMLYVGDCGVNAKKFYGMSVGPDTVCVKAFSFVDKINLKGTK